MTIKRALLVLLLGGVYACNGAPLVAQNDAFSVTRMADFDRPWAMAFLPDGRVLVTEQRGELKLLAQEGTVSDITGIPEVAFAGQGGLGDVALHPDFKQNQLLYISYAEEGKAGVGAVVARGRLELEGGAGQLAGLEVIWRQQPKVSGHGHYGHRIMFGPEGYLWITSGERQKFDPAQDMQGNLGKIIRLRDGGSVPDDNPFAHLGGVAAQVWSLGHRNPLGIAFDPLGNLWVVEMGPAGGDELNRVERGANYGYPIVSDGDHYNGRDIPDHATRPEFNAPAVSWTPVISPSSLVFYTGDIFPDWHGDALIGGLSSQGLVRVEFTGESAREAERYPMQARIRAVAQGPDGAIWLLEDGKRGSAGRLLRLSAPLNEHAQPGTPPVK